MAKLRKMLGRADDPKILALMRMIETQNKTTLARWAMDCARERYLPIYEECFPEDPRLGESLHAAASCLAGELTLKDLKAHLKAAREFPKEAEGAPAAQAAARAVITACLRRPPDAHQRPGVRVLRRRRQSISPGGPDRLRRCIRCPGRRGVRRAGGYPDGPDGNG